MYKRHVMIKTKNGIHLRIAAEIVHLSQKLKGKYDINLYVRRKNDADPLGISMLALLSLRIKEGEVVEFSCMEDTNAGKNAVEELCQFITSKFGASTNEEMVIDKLMEESTLANEQILENIPSGIIVIDKYCSITFINSYGTKLLGKSPHQVVGKDVREVLPTTELPKVIETAKPQYGHIEHIEKSIVMANRAPLIWEGEVLGAIAIFQDISEMVGLKEVNEKFKKILEASHDLICFVDEDRKISYVNPAYERVFSLKEAKCLGCDLQEVSPKGLRMKAFQSREAIENHLYEKDGVGVIATVEPLFIDGQFKGVVSISRELSELKELIEQLKEREEEINYYREELHRQREQSVVFSNMVGFSGALRECLYVAQKAAQSTSTVLIRGESGTGKELIAHSIHENSDRVDKPFVRVNCGAIPENLLESELFGYEKGAFTGATKDKPGKFTIAHGGTIFLDEIGDLPRAMQVKLLRVLQEKEFEAVGSIKTQKVDVRIIAATNRDLELMLQSGEFREDLYYRLNVLTITLPPLRDRKEDIPLLAEHFIKKINTRLNKSIASIDKKSLSYLQGYSWPGNIRELENVIERAINLCEGEIIHPEDLPFYIGESSEDKVSLINMPNGELSTLEEYEREIIKAAMKKYKSFNRAAQALGITHRTVALKCRKYDIV